MDADKIFATVKENADAIDRLAKKVKEGRKDIVGIKEDIAGIKVTTGKVETKVDKVAEKVDRDMDEVRDSRNVMFKLIAWGFGVVGFVMTLGFSAIGFGISRLLP